ncbi:DUF5667 domain-containing protein [Streptacidiphilus sp. N1-12]|uniref:DUF5667 domain-containing protein n=2 Tax=Streptacidiphilus alkalitolerans TaxID=3342712 RepID=A0ABV6VA51_9ACTN
MTANVLEHRRARAFADAVEDRPSTTAAGQQEGQFTEMVATVQELRATPVPVLDPAVKRDQRALLMAEFERAFAGGGGASVVPEQRSRGAHRATEAARRFRPNTRWGRRLVVGGLAAGVALGTFGGVAAASTSAVPGDALYGMKRGLEDWQLNLAGSDAERGRLLLDQATQRMTEAQKLTAHQRPGETLSPHLLAEVSRALTDMNTEGSQGRDLLKAIYAQNHSLAPMQQLAHFAGSQQQRLAAIEPKLDGRLDPVTGKVQTLLSGISEDLAPLHLAATQGGSGAPGDSGGSAPGGSGQSGRAVSSGRQGATGAPQGATTQGTGSHGGATATAGPTTQGTGGLVGSVGGLLDPAPSASPTAADRNGGTDGGPTPAPSGNSVTIPPLLPGLLPGLGLGVSGS